jgi:hypothetical protein
MALRFGSPPPTPAATPSITTTLVVAPAARHRKVSHEWFGSPATGSINGAPRPISFQKARRRGRCPSLRLSAARRPVIDACS